MSEQAPETASTLTGASARAAETAQTGSQSGVDWESKLKQTSTQSYAAGRREAQEDLEAAKARIRELEQSTQARAEAEASAEELRKKLAEERKQREGLEQFRAERLERDKAKLRTRAEGLPDRLRQTVERALERDDTDTADDLIEAYAESLPKPNEKPAPKSPQGKPAANDGPALNVRAVAEGINRGDLRPYQKALRAGISKAVLDRAMGAPQRRR